MRTEMLRPIAAALAVSALAAGASLKLAPPPSCVGWLYPVRSPMFVKSVALGGTRVLIGLSRPICADEMLEWGYGLDDGGVR